MKKTETKNTKVFFSVDSKINENFEEYCEQNFINKSKIIEALMKSLVDNSDEINKVLKK